MYPILAPFVPKGDPRVENWSLMDEPTITIALIALYLGFVKWWGPALMRDREPFTLRPLLLAYNFVMVILSAWLVKEFGVVGWFGGGYSLACQPVDYSRRPSAMRMANVCWVFYVSKLIELLDTVFFVLRKKFDQVSFLHVFHHASMAFSWWVGVKYVAGGSSTFHAILNSAVHVMMYSYYGLSAAGPRFRRFLWWKRYMTTIQIVQFVVIILHCVFLLTLRDCKYPNLFNYWILCYAGIFLILFSSFYVNAYGQRQINRKPINSDVQMNTSTIQAAEKSK